MIKRSYISILNGSYKKSPCNILSSTLACTSTPGITLSSGIALKSASAMAEVPTRTNLPEISLALKLPFNISAALIYLKCPLSPL